MGEGLVNKDKCKKKLQEEHKKKSCFYEICGFFCPCLFYSNYTNTIFPRFLASLTPGVSSSGGIVCQGSSTKTKKVQKNGVGQGY